MKMKCVLILLGILGVALLGIVMDIGYTPPDKGEVFVPQVSSTWTEINPARTDEDRRDHFRDETGRHRVEIYYKNGNRGTVITRADRTAESERYTRADGSLIKEVFF